MIILISRDKRVHSLFRSSWESVLLSKNYNYISLFSNRGIITKLLTIHKNYVKLFHSNKIVIFGIQDVLLYKFLFIPKVRKYFVITGFGRLWLNTYSRIFTILIFKIFFRHDKIAVLNKDDFTLFNSYGLNNVYHLHGEGNSLLDNVIDHKKNIHKSTNNILNFVYVGRFLKSKGILETIEFIINFNKYTKINISLTLIGDYDFKNKDSVAQSDILRLKQYGIKVFNLGYSSNPWELISKNSIFISLSYREGLPFSVLEALHFNHYCILSFVPGHKEFEIIPGLSFVDDNLNYNNLHRIINDWNNQSSTQKFISRKKYLSIYSQQSTCAEKLKFLQI